MASPIIAPGCPWADWTRPDIAWCEQPVCSVVANPGNTASSLAYLAVGLWILHQCRARGLPGLTVLGWAAIVMGLGSASYHASLTFVFQFGDFLGMFGYLTALLVLNLRRAGRAPTGSITPLFSGLMLGLGAVAAALFAAGIPMQPLVPVLMVGLFASEAWLWRREGGFSGRDRAPWLLAMAWMAAAGAAWGLELSRVWCDPSAHVVQGHFWWHVLSAGSIAPLFRYYAQFEPVR